MLAQVPPPDSATYPTTCRIYHLRLATLVGLTPAPGEAPVFVLEVPILRSEVTANVWLPTHALDLSFDAGDFNPFVRDDKCSFLGLCCDAAMRAATSWDGGACAAELVVKSTSTAG